MPDAQELARRLREARDEAGLTQQQVADWLGVRRPAIAEIEGGSRGVKSKELVRLAALYGRSLSWLVEGEMGVEERIGAALFRAEDEPDPALQREAAKLGKRCGLVAQLERRLGLARRHARMPRYEDPRALDDWSDALAHGKSVAYQERARLGIGESAALRDPWGIVEDAGIRVFPLELGDDHPIDGIFTRLGDGQACVGVNVDKWLFRQVFTVVHEYGHGLMDGDLTGETCDTAKAWQQGPPSRRYANREMRANQFAAVFLVPREALLWFLDSRGKLSRRERAQGLTAVDLVRAQDHFGTSGAMLLWRLQNEDLIDGETRKALRDELDRIGTMNLARSLGYDWQRFAQPFGRARELALQAYAKGQASLGTVAEVFGEGKEAMKDLLDAWEIYQELTEDDVLVGGPA